MIFIYLFISLFFIHSELNSGTVDYSPKNQQPDSEQAHLLMLLDELPDELEITDPVHLEDIEGYIQKTEQGFDAQIVVDYAKTIKKAITPLAAYMKGAEAIRTLYDDFESSLDRKQEQTLLITIAELNNWANNYEVAFEMIDEILPDIEDEYLRGLAYSTIALSAGRLGRYDLGIEYYLNATTIFREGNHSVLLAESFNRLGNLYYNLEDYEISISYYQQHIDLAMEAEDEEALANGYSNIGAAYRQAGNYEEALEAFRNGLEISEQVGNVMELARVKMNIANLYSSMQRFDEALQSYKESLAICEEYGITEGVILNQLNLGELYFKQKRYDESEKAYIASYNMMSKENHIYEYLRITELLAQLYETTGDYQSAFTFIKLHDEISGEIFDAEKLEITEDLRNKYESDLKENEIALAESTIDTLRLEKYIYISLVVSLSIIFISGFIYYRKQNEYFKILYKKNLDVLDALGVEKKAAIVSKRSDEEISQSSDYRDKLYQKIKPLFTDEKIYRDPDVNLSMIAKRVGSNRKYVSEAIRKSSSMSFNSYLNFYRITDAKKMILDGEESLNEVQFACGFNSRTTFYTAFKKITGMSPSRFKKMSEQDNL